MLQLYAVGLVQLPGAALASGLSLYPLRVGKAQLAQCRALGGRTLKGAVFQRNPGQLFKLVPLRRAHEAVEDFLYLGEVIVAVDRADDAVHVYVREALGVVGADNGRE